MASIQEYVTNGLQQGPEDQYEGTAPNVAKPIKMKPVDTATAAIHRPKGTRDIEFLH